MAKKNFYAVRYGINPDTGEDVKDVIFKSWKETETYIRGVKGAEYKGFVTKDEAEDFLEAGDPLMNKNDNNYPKNSLHCYVDGSYREDKKNYSYALVCIKNDEVIGFEGGLGNNPEAVSMQQIGGELLGAIKALIYAKKNNHKEVVIFHDYIGTCYHATGYWKRDNNFSKIYYDWMQKFFKDNPGLKVIFCKVDAHSNHAFNEIADGIAKLSLGLEPDKKFYKFCEEFNMDLSSLA